MTTALLLGFGLAAPVLAVARAAVAGSARDEGFPVAVVLAQSLHPLTLVQMLVGNWHGELDNLSNRWWGSNFFPLGFPYVLSLYVGATALALALVGLRRGTPLRKRIAAMACVGLVATLGARAGLGPLIEAFALFRVFRFPAKAFFTVHMCLALLVALGLAHLADPRSRTGWRILAAGALLIGGLLTLAPALPTLAPSISAWFLRGFLPPSYDWPHRLATADAILHDAARGGVISVCLGLLGAARLSGAVNATRASAAAVALLATDLLRAGAGLNPMVDLDFYRLSPEMESVASVLRRGDGRTFACDPESGPEYFRARALRAEHDVFTFATLMETLTPAYNLNAGVATALSRDLTMLVPQERVLSPEESGAAAVPKVLDRLRTAGVAWVLCLEPLEDPRLRPVTTLAPARIAPLRVHLYEVSSPHPRFELSGGGRVVAEARQSDKLVLRFEADHPGRLHIGEAWAPGWSARVDDQPAVLERSEDGHRAVGVPAGAHTMSLAYEPPGLRAATTTSLMCLAALVGAWGWSFCRRNSA
jgi:hypothetical protein